MLGAGEQQRRLVHDPARHPDGPLLGTPADLGQLQTGRSEIGGGAEGQRDRDLERSGGRQAGAWRQVGDDATAEADRRPAGCSELYCDRGHVPGPPLALVPILSVCRHDGRLGKTVGFELDRVPAHRSCHGHAALDRHREDESAAVVRVLPDQVDAARGAEGALHVDCCRHTAGDATRAG